MKPGKELQKWSPCPRLISALLLDSGNHLDEPRDVYNAVLDGAGGIGDDDVHDIGCVDPAVVVVVVAAAAAAAVAAFDVLVDNIDKEQVFVVPRAAAALS